MQRPILLLCTGLVFALSACYDDTQPTGPGSLQGDTIVETVSSGNTGGNYVGWNVPVSVKVRLKNGTPLSGVTVTFNTAPEHGRLYNGFSGSLTATAATDALGIASIAFSPGVAGSGVYLEASVLNAGLDSIPIDLTARPMLAGAGANERWCGLELDGTLGCWKHAYPTGATLEGPYRFTLANTALRFTSLKASGFTWCALATTGALYCWDNRHFGAAGSATEMQATPQEVATPVSFTEFIIGGNSSDQLFTANAPPLLCGLDATQHLWCKGQYVGDGTATTYATFVAAAGGLAFRKVHIGRRAACGVDLTGLAWCWGVNAKSLGVPPAGSTILLVPTRVGGDRHYRAVAQANYGTCGIEEVTDEVYCWGAQSSPALVGGTGFETVLTTPTPFIAGKKATAFDATGTDGYFLTQTGALEWFGDIAGMGGDATVPTPTASSNTPPNVTALLGGGSSYLCVRYGAGSGSTYCTYKMVRGASAPPR